MQTQKVTSFPIVLLRNRLLGRLLVAARAPPPRPARSAPATSSCSPWPRVDEAIAAIVAAENPGRRPGWGPPAPDRAARPTAPATRPEGARPATVGGWSQSSSSRSSSCALVVAVLGVASGRLPASPMAEAVRSTPDPGLTRGPGGAVDVDAVRFDTAINDHSDGATSTRHLGRCGTTSPRASAPWPGCAPSTPQSPPPSALPTRPRAGDDVAFTYNHARPSGGGPTGRP